jgi:hypothetical protein
MKRALPLVALGALVLIALGALVLKLRRAPVEGAAERPTPTAAPPVERGVRDHRGQPTTPARRDARASRRAGTAAAPGTPESRPDGVADHRGQPVAPVEKPKYEVEPTVIAHTRLALRPVIKRCATEHAAELVGSRPRVQTVVDVEVTDGVLRLSGLTIQTRDVPEDGALVACVRDGAAGLTVPAEGHREVEHHRLTFPFELPLR